MATTFFQPSAITPDYEHIKSAYTKNIISIPNAYAPIHIFSTGSNGNSILIKPLRLLIDLGLPKKHYLEYDPNFFDAIKYIVITHHHGDHLNPSTLFYILENYKHIKVIISNFLWNYVTSIKYKAVKKNGVKTYPWAEKFQKHSARFIPAEPLWLPINESDEFKLTPRTVKHGDIVNIALQIYHQPSNLCMLYCTDIDNLKGGSTFYSSLMTQETVQGLNQNVMYNAIFLEANYSEEKIQQWETDMEIQIKNDQSITDEEREHLLSNVWTRANNNRRHISEDEAFLYINRFLESDGIFIPLHASSMFGTLFQD